MVAAIPHVRHFKPGNDVLFYYKGEMNNKVLRAIMNLMARKLRRYKEPQRRVRQINNALIELMQNLIYHKETGLKDREHAPMVLILRSGNHYLIQTANAVDKKKGQWLRKYLDSINNMTKEELEKRYREILTNGRFNPEGGAGLGLLNIARKAVENKLNYEFEPINNQYETFHLFVLL